MYRLTPNPSTPKGKSPAETLLYSTLRSTFDLPKPPKEVVASSNQKMESHYNRKHDAKWRHFDIEQRVLVKDYRGNRAPWRQGKIPRRIGNVIYHVRVRSEILVRHANQLKEAYSQPTQRLNILIEHLDMNRGRTTDTQVAEQLSEVPVYQQLRRSTRRMPVTNTQTGRGDNNRPGIGLDTINAVSCRSHEGDTLVRFVQSTMSD
ncbi:hypothetical protein T265_10278 [Opisthorchis viverrini]|uniref:Uncharacterized protein n=1 Tax=Opisthorchis viverrini TaxID=6198 RepID=A0A075A1T7_OPIVI|nr:hypothetical protein T265_10278 [Opisthorchis viverrini]KER21374.1 hypothetical protein T265_10278 [Opisthorchis viverrini]